MTSQEALEILEDESARENHKKVQEAINVIVALVNTPLKKEEKSK